MFHLKPECFLLLFYTLYTIHTFRIENKYADNGDIWFNCSGDEENVTITTDDLYKFLEVVKETLPHEYDIPNLDYGHYSSNDMYLISTLNDAKLMDPSTMDVIEANVDLMNLQFNATIKYENLNITGLYFLNFSSPLLEMFGEGYSWVNLTDVYVNLDLEFAMTPGDLLFIYDVNLNFNISDIQLELNGMYGNDTEADIAVNQIANEAIPALLEQGKPIILEQLKQDSQYLDFFFEDMALGQLVCDVFHNPIINPIF